MMIKPGGYMLATAMLVVGMAACNSDSSVETGYTSDNLYSSTSITSFNIKANTSVISNLDSLYFTIDLVGSQIFNADSLPVGTDVTKLIPNITTSSSSLIEISVSGSEVMNDTTFAYTSESTDSIDFSENTKVTARVVSYNGRYSQTYDLKVNVHKVKSDSLYWGTVAWKEMPGHPDAQKSVEYDDKIMTLTSTSGSYSLWIQDEPAEDGTTITVTFPSTPVIESFASTTDALFCLDADGKLMTSTDSGSSWSYTGETWSHIYGGYDTILLGLEKDGDDYYHVTYPSNGTRTKAAIDCPVSGTSQIVLFENKWADGPIALIVGGRIANGNLTGATWGYDGTGWACLSNAPITTPYEDMTMFPYFYVNTTTKWWRPTTESIILAVGGRQADGSVSDTVYISQDAGIHWEVADSMLQLPDYIPAFAQAQSFVKESTLSSRSASSWNELPLYRNPFMSRAVTEITSWECPYIYLYGGVDAAGTLYPQIWRGVINKFTFKPIE